MRSAAKPSPSNKNPAQNAYAHSLKNRPVEEWEPLPVHLTEVGRETDKRAAKFGAASMGSALGRWHDFGKFKLAFQRYLHDPKVSGKGHSTAGAVYAYRHLPESLGRIIAHAVAGHHAGLSDALLARDGRLARGAAELDLALAGHAAAPSGYELPPDPEAPDLKPDGPYRTGFQFAFLIRMLFSCLVDADRACTARFYRRDVEPWPRATIDALSAALTSALEADERARRAKGEDRRAVNLRRAEILAAARAHADDAPGVFTLTVPTGGGKTLTGLDFALRHAARHGRDRVIVVIPFTSVIEQTAAVYRAALGSLGGEVLEHHSALDEDDLRGEHRQGEDKLRLAMENWDARIVVTTAVQFFESLFSNRPSQCRKLHNLANSVVILDEAQTIPLRLLRPCVAALRELVRNYGVSLVLSTATQPALLERPNEPGQPSRSFEGGFPEEEVTELAPDPPRLFALMRRVAVVAIGEQDDPALARRMREADQALCIVNTRRHARELFREIAGDLTETHHLSTMMHAEHRSRVLAGIKADLKAGRACRVVSTSLIEAGVDIDFPLVLRAETGADQFAQAAGRLNREGRREREESFLLLFKPVGQWTPKQMQPNIDAGRNVLRCHAEACFGPEAIEAYFRQVYWQHDAAGLDEPGILKLCHDAGPTLDFPFATIATGMRLIDQVTRPVIVATDDESRRWLAELKNPWSEEALRTITRGLQRYTVGLPRHERQKLLGTPAAQAVRPEVFGDQFVELVNMDLYRPDIGLDCSDPYFIESGRLVV